MNIDEDHLSKRCATKQMEGLDGKDFEEIRMFWGQKKIVLLLGSECQQIHPAGVQAESVSLSHFSVS